MKNVLLILFLTAGTLFAQTNEEPIITAIDGYAARVDSTIITYGDIRKSIAPFMPQLFRRYQGQELAEQIQKVNFEAREALIDEALLKEEAKALGLGLPPHIVEKEIARIIRTRFNNNRALLNRVLAERRTTFEEWEKEVTDQVTLQVYYAQEVTRNASVSEEAVRTAYEQDKESYLIPLKVKFSVILLNKGTTEEDQAVKKNQAENVLQKLLNGADFGETAKEVSEGIRADQGGAFPWKEPKEVSPALRPALRTVATGTISDLIETDEEFYIVKIQERREQGYTPFETVRKPIHAKLLEQERQRLHKTLLQRLAGQHFVVRY